MNGMSQPITFAVDSNTPLAALRTKKAGDSSVTSRRAHKIPLSTLDSCFIEWLRYGKYCSYLKLVQSFNYCELLIAENLRGNGSVGLPSD